MTLEKECRTIPKWYVLRDLKRPNAKMRAYQMLQQSPSEQLKVFTPMTKHVVTRAGKKVVEEKPIINDLLFVYANRLTLDPLIEMIDTLQYRYVRGGGPQEPMVVADKEMMQFITIVEGQEPVRFYKPEEVSAAIYGRKIRIVGGQLDGYEGRLMTTRGSKVKRLIVELEGILAVAVEVHPEEECVYDTPA